MKTNGKTSGVVEAIEAVQPLSVVVEETGEEEEVAEVEGDTGMLIQQYREESRPEGGEIPVVVVVDGVVLAAAAADGLVLAVVVDGEVLAAAADGEVLAAMVDGEGEVLAAGEHGGMLPELGTTPLL